MVLNPFFAERLPRVAPDVPLGVIIDTPPSRLSQTLSALQTLGVVPADTVFSQFLLAMVPAGLIDQIAKIEGVTVHYNMPKTVLSQIPIPTPIADIIQNDPLLGPIRTDSIVIPGIKPFGAPPPPELVQPNIKIIPTGLSKAVILDIQTNLTGRGVLLAVIDTGTTPFHPQLMSRNVILEDVTGELPVDMMGHGMWCTTAAAGNPFNTRFGKCEGIATAADILHVKALSTSGMGTSFGIIKAMEVAFQRGARVVSMSLGGDLQGSVFDDPEIKVVEGLSKLGMIFVIAAGNSGPSQYTIGSPGAAPSAITVGSFSITDAPSVAYFSSRGPQGSYYMDHPDELKSAEQVYGDDIHKPDVVAPGGGRADASAQPDEVLYSGVTGWFDAFYDLLPDTFEGMHGTSQATPAVAGLIALLVEGGFVKSAADFKRVMAKHGHPKTDDDGYGLARLSFFSQL